MKSKLKITLLIVTGVVVIGAGTLFYNYYGLYKNMTTNPDEIAKDESSGIQTENPFDKISITDTAQGEDGQEVEDDIEDKDNEKSKNNEETSKNDQEKENIKEKEQANNSNTLDGKKETKKKTKTEEIVDEQLKDPAYVDTIEPYKQRFQNLQSKQEGQLNRLVEQGKAEYIEAKKNGKSTASLGVKYLNEARRLESQSEKEFNSLKSELRRDLKGKSYDPAIVEEVEGYYKYRKNSMQHEILSKIKGS